MRDNKLSFLCLSFLWLACSSAGGVGTGGGAGAGGAGAGGAGAGSGGGGTGGGHAGAGGRGTGGEAGRDGGGTGGGGLAGAAGADAGMAGSGGGTAGADAGTADAGGTPFSAVQPILAASCVRCHDPAHPVVPETQTFVALNLTARGAYAALVDKPATETCGGTLVKPGDPTKSFLYAKITQDTPCDGQRMPHQGMIRTPPLPAEQIAVFESWIRGGAKP